MNKVFVWEKYCFKNVVFPVPLAPNRKKLLDFNGFIILWNILHKYTINMELCLG